MTPKIVNTRFKLVLPLISNPIKIPKNDKDSIAINNLYSILDIIFFMITYPSNPHVYNFLSSMILRFKKFLDSLGQRFYYQFITGRIGYIDTHIVFVAKMSSFFP